MTTMTLSIEEYDDLLSRLQAAERKAKEYQAAYDKSVDLALRKAVDHQRQLSDFKSEVRGIRAEAEKLAILFSAVSQDRDRLLRELAEVKGQLELIDEV